MYIPRHLHAETGGEGAEDKIGAKVSVIINAGTFKTLTFKLYTLQAKARQVG